MALYKSQLLLWFRNLGRLSPGIMTTPRFFWTVLFVTPYYVGVYSTNGGLPVKEYCEREVFEAGCPDGEVILIQTAVYGRMKLGRCVRQEYESLGCKVNVLAVVDSKCSGRTDCRFHTSELHQYSQCNNDLVAYLEASYECVPVISCESEVCNAGNFFRITLSSGFLVSSDASSGRCGSSTCPWIFSPHQGQRFNLTFYSFLVPEQPEKYCHRLASIADKAARFTKDVTICSGQEGRTVTHMTPESVLVEVVMYIPSSPGSDSPTFSLLRYEAIGCPDQTAPEGGWVSRKGELLTVGCDRIKRTWHLTCDGTNWIGEAGTCNDDLNAPPHGQLVTEHWDIGVALQQASSTTHGLLLIVGIGVVLGILLGFTMLSVAVVLIKRRRRLARIELREACLAQLSKTDLTSSSSNNLYNQSILSGGGGVGCYAGAGGGGGGGGGGTSEKLSLTDTSYAAYHPRTTTGSTSEQFLIRRLDTTASRHTAIRILGPVGRSSSPPRGFPPPPPPPGQTVVNGGQMDTGAQFLTECT